MLRRIIAMLPMHYDLSALMHKATHWQDAEPKARGGTCDVTFGTVPWADIARNCDVRSRCVPVYDGESDSRFLHVAIKRARARAHVLNSLPPEKREKFIKVKTELYVYIDI